MLSPASSHALDRLPLLCEHMVVFRALPPRIAYGLRAGGYTSSRPSVSGCIWPSTRRTERKFIYA